MEFRPARHTTPSQNDTPNDGPVRRTPTTPPRQSPAQPQEPLRSPRTDQETRSFYGFDDIPVESEDMSDVRFVDILKAWGKRAIKHSPLEEKADKQRKRFDNLKNDIKWAMQADLDEPVKRTPKQQAPPPKSVDQHTPGPSTGDSSKTIDININFGSLPKIPDTKGAFKKALSRIKTARPSRKYTKALGVIGVVAIGTGGWFLIPGSPGSIQNDKPSVSTIKDAGPTYTTVLPDGKSVEVLGGWRRVSPDDRDPVYAYVDKINDVSVNVSQQPLPKDFKSDTSDRVAELAKAYGATTKVESGSDTIYIGTSEKGPQSAIVAKNDTLILMKSAQKIPDEAWSSYVKALK